MLELKCVVSAEIFVDSVAFSMKQTDGLILGDSSQGPLLPAPRAVDEEANGALRIRNGPLAPGFCVPYLAIIVALLRSSPPKNVHSVLRLETAIKCLEELTRLYQRQHVGVHSFVQ